MVVAVGERPVDEPLSHPRHAGERAGTAAARWRANVLYVCIPSYEAVQGEAIMHSLYICVTSI